MFFFSKIKRKEKPQMKKRRRKRRTKLGRKTKKKIDVSENETFECFVETRLK